MSGAFFHKGISRFQAELLLTNAKDDGSFLVRDSESLPGAYVLCLIHQAKVHQYRILPGPDGKLHVQSETGTIQRGYQDLTELIAEYIKKQDQNGLASALVHPVPPERSSEDMDISDDEDDDDDDDDEDFECPPPMVSPPATPTEKKNGHSETAEVDLAKNFAKLDLRNLDVEFTTALKEYVDQGYKKDSVSMNVGDSELHEFTNVLEVASSGLKRELDSFMKKMSVLNEFLKFDRQKHSTLDSKYKVTGAGLPNLLEQLSRVRTEVLNIQTKAQETIQLASLPSDYEYLDPPDGVYCESGITSGPFLASTYRPYIPQSKFEVKKVKHGKQTKLTLTVDLQNGKYSILKQTGKESLGTDTISHERILHLIKCTKDKCILDVILDGKKKQNYIFADPHARENFCLQIRQMKNMHSTETEIDQISVFIGTWNMGDASLNQSLSTWLKCTGAGKCRDRVLGVIPHDMYVVGTQESSMTEKDWVNTLKAGLKACVLVDMELVEVCTLWGIRIAILVKPEYKHCISRIQRSSVRTGIANALGNKGAVAISFYFNGSSFCFINAHLTSGDERCNRRNQNYRDIMKNLTINLGQKHLNLFDITSQFHHVFWLGDLNYRVEEDIQVLLHKVQEKDINYLMEKDQLKRLQSQKAAFCGFQESEITFLPTYRLERNIPGYRYAWRKVKKTGERINAPSWCDRVLWKSYPGVFIENVAYGCSEAILSSDHRPVFSSFNVGISSEFVQARGSLAELAPVKIIFHSIEAQVKTCCKQYFQLVFHSTCLQEVYRSQSNTSFQDNRTGFYTVPVWHACNLPEMKPLFGDQDFLEEQHILIAVIAKDGDNESYGECVLSLKDMFSNQPKDFEYTLLHQGEETGKIKGKMHLVSKSKRSSKKSPYSLIAFDTEYQDPEMFVSGTPKMDFHPSVRQGSKPGSFVVKHPTVSPKVPLRQVMSSCQDDRRGTYDKVQIPTRELARSTRVDSRAPQPLPPSISSSQPAPPPRRPPYMGQTGLIQGSQRVPPRHPSQSDSAPPVPPKQRPSVVGDHGSKYDDLKRPLSLEEWLAQLNLSCYEQNFKSNGWESLMYLNELTLTDLSNMGVDIREHQQKILQSIKELNKDTGPTYHVLEEHDIEEHSDDIFRKEPGVYNDDLAEPVYHEIVVSTLEEWLTTLGLSCYINVFHDNGWENLMVLGEMTEADLDRMEINNRSHRSLILSCIEDFKSC
ncbi:phosphatidylinositol 3,4,5-trisphosphate 5-phosphatase 2-like isoform X2 [Ruditapes philippinarum]|nr:phosphatidylinositol 3,4,5-trisphosphate 5-phosphatase 2-like isoform X2 [Ruditapes philippinarum]XP_060553620.1 phosphatidylinositol 3,4,5-trisphosphate 5-phosphatase 2-like isoform X2 [Ruditapes philippinarum]